MHVKNMKEHSPPSSSSKISLGPWFSIDKLKGTERVGGSEEFGDTAGWIGEVGENGAGTGGAPLVLLEGDTGLATDAGSTL